jgi:hypothetical protein
MIRLACPAVRQSGHFIYRGPGAKMRRTQTVQTQPAGAGPGGKQTKAEQGDRPQN